MDNEHVCVVHCVLELPHSNCFGTLLAMELTRKAKIVLDYFQTKMISLHLLFRSDQNSKKQLCLHFVKMAMQPRVFLLLVALSIWVSLQSFFRITSRLLHQLNSIFSSFILNIMYQIGHSVNMFSCVIIFKNHIILPST